nr:hypothetical protein [Terriglobales bacterium]
MKRGFIIVMAVLLLGAAGMRIYATRSMGLIVNSKHDFRVQSTAAIRSTSQGDPCVFCHTPHNSTPGTYLWNRKLPKQNYPGYSSTTMQSSPSHIQSEDVSKLCLSCHDGTIALGETLSDGMVE